MTTEVKHARFPKDAQSRRVSRFFQVFIWIFWRRQSHSQHEDAGRPTKALQGSEVLPFNTQKNFYFISFLFVRFQGIQSTMWLLKHIRLELLLLNV